MYPYSNNAATFLQPSANRIGRPWWLPSMTQWGCDIKDTKKKRQTNPGSRWRHACAVIAAASLQPTPGLSVVPSSPSPLLGIRWPWICQIPSTKGPVCVYQPCKAFCSFSLRFGFSISPLFVQLHGLYFRKPYYVYHSCILRYIYLYNLYTITSCYKTGQGGWVSIF